MKKLAILSSLILLALNSCSNEDIITEELPNNYEKRITVVAEDLTPAEGTRTSYTENGNGYSFAWSEGDALGIFPENGYQTAFPIGTDGVGSNTAVFDGGKWALRPNESYAAYYPLVDKLSLDSDAIPVDYTGQTQIGNNSTAHLSKYDFMASSFNDVDDKGNVNFQLQHLGCLVQFKLTMPEADTYSALEIESDNTPFITSGKYSISDNSHALFDIDQSNTFIIGLNKISTTEENKHLTIAAMFAPTDLTGSMLTLTVRGKNRIYTFDIDGKDLTQGRASTIQEIPYVTFQADAEQTLTMNNAVETLEYSVDGSNWEGLGTKTVSFGGANGKLRLRGSNGYGTAKDFSNQSSISFGTNALVMCSGDIRTLADFENYMTEDTEDDKYYNLFSGCKALASAPKLPAETLAEYCYFYMFKGCSSLVNGPELPAETLADNCYYGMFSDCRSLSNAPKLPAKTLATSCYEHMFSNCRSLSNAPELPAETLAEHCYSSMFSSCISLVNAPRLSAKILARMCCSGMFSNCTSLVNAPELLAETLAESCYILMFSGCTSLENAPKLFAKSLASSCYQEMFSKCTSLVNAPELPVEILAESCYLSMFNGCTSLINAPELPAKTLVKSCYSSMFCGCTSLVNAPELPAETLAEKCYQYMFYGCSNLNYVKMLATDISAPWCTNYWLSKVSATGTFVKNSAANWNVEGESGIPSGWTVKYDGENNINNGHEFVDLGLSVKWATCNVGAEKPEDYGNYYAWGETIGTESGKTIFTWDSYFDTSSVPGYNNRGEYIISFKKYQLNSKDLNTVIEPSDDAATVNWGTEWRIPTFSEMQELVNDCSWEWVTINGVNGYKVTGKGNGNFIFLPAAGWYGDSGLADDNACCSYWMSTMSPYYNYTGCMLSCNSSNGGNDITCQGSVWRCRGLSVRAVCP